ncbi:MAG: glycerophosphodiester phosphodiesterase family protein [Pseudomonadota bacterium]
MSQLSPDFWTKPFAHRGLHDRNAGIEENSFAAFRAAIDAGYGIELDVQLAADGEAIVFHDSVLDRLTDTTGSVSSFSTARLSTLRLKIGGEPLPTLSEVLGLIDGATPVLVEIKDQSGDFSGTSGVLEARVAEVMARYRGPAAVMSFNPHMIETMWRIAPATPRGLVAAPRYWGDVSPERARRLADLADLDRCRAAFVSYEWRGLDRPAVRRAALQGHELICWTIQSAADAEAVAGACRQITFEGFRP